MGCSGAAGGDGRAGELEAMSGLLGAPLSSEGATECRGVAGEGDSATGVRWDDDGPVCDVLAAGEPGSGEPGGVEASGAEPCTDRRGVPAGSKCEAEAVSELVVRPVDGTETLAAGSNNRVSSYRRIRSSMTTGSERGKRPGEELGGGNRGDIMECSKGKTFSSKTTSLEM
jgi:hypothetical protein